MFWMDLFIKLTKCLQIKVVLREHVISSIVLLANQRAKMLIPRLCCDAFKGGGDFQFQSHYYYLRIKVH